MAGKTKSLTFSEGVAVTAPTDVDVVDSTNDFTLTGEITFDDAIGMKEISTPANPASGYGKFYRKSDGKLYHLDSAGSEVEVGSGGGGGSAVNLIENKNGDNALDQGQTNDVQDWIDSGAGTTSTRTTTASEIPLNTNKDNAIKIAFATGTADYTRIRFTMPEALKNSKLGIKWIQRVSSYTASTAKIELYYNASSDYTGAYTEVSLSSDDSSGDTYLPNFSGVVSTSFDEPGEDYYELRIVNTGATTGYISFNEWEVGPGVVAFGPSVDGGTSFTTVSNLTTNIVEDGWYYRVGSRMKVYGAVRFTGTNTDAEVYPKVPAGYTIDVSRMADVGSGSSDEVAVGTWSLRDDGSTTWYTGTVVCQTLGSSSLFLMTNVTAKPTVNTNTNSPITIASGDVLSWEFDVPISEWAGAATGYIGNNRVEYASNSGTWDASDTSSFQYGPTGQGITDSDLTQTRTKRVQFQTPIQPTDRIVVEFKVNNAWVEAVGSIAQSSGYAVQGFHYATSTAATGTAGVGWRPVSGSTTQVDVYFGRYVQVYDNAGTATGVGWSSLQAASNEIYWRVVKHSAGLPVGFGLADATNAGLVSKETSGDVAHGDITFSLDSSSWTVDSADLTYFSWNRVGDVVSVYVKIDNSSVGAGSNTALMDLSTSVMPSPAFATTAPALINDNASTKTDGNCIISVSGSTITIAINKNDGSAWTASTNNTDVVLNFSYRAA